MKTIKMAEKEKKYCLLTIDKKIQRTNIIIIIIERITNPMKIMQTFQPHSNTTNEASVEVNCLVISLIKNSKIFCENL